MVSLLTHVRFEIWQVPLSHNCDCDFLCSFCHAVSFALMRLFHFCTDHHDTIRAFLIRSFLNIKTAPTRRHFRRHRQSQVGENARARWLKAGFILTDQSIRNPKRQGVANKNRKSATDSSDNSFAPRPASQCPRKQRESERNPELAENDVPRRKRNHAATTVLPPMNSSRHLLVERNIDRAEQPDHEQTNFAEPFPQSQSDIIRIALPQLPKPAASTAVIARPLGHRQSNNPVCVCNRPATHQPKAL